MKKFLGTISVVLLLSGLVGGSGCILADKIIEIVLTNETYADFAEFETSASWTHPDTLDDYASDLDEALDEAGYSRSDIQSASVMAAHYGVTKYAQSGDWQISGRITVQRLNPTGAVATLIDYTSVSVAGALGAKIAAPLNAAGVAVINQALTDFITGQDPVLVFAVENGSVVPTPTPTSPIEFDWRAWITVQVLIRTTVEDVPDPF